MPPGLIFDRSISGSDNVSITVEITETEILFRYFVPGGFGYVQNIFLALRTHREMGAAVLPFAQNAEGSTVFLPFKADLLLSVELKTDQIRSFGRRWEHWQWTNRERIDAFEGNRDEVVFRLSRDIVLSECIDFVLYAKDPMANDGWGWFWGCSDRTVDGGTGDKCISHYHQLKLSDSPTLTLRSRAGTEAPRVRIYQLFVRLFGNTNETRKQNGTLAENGVGKFKDINQTALRSLHDAGFTHIWLTGLLQQATATDYSEIGQPADDPDLLKGLAGSPYAIKDYFDVCPDYATDPKKRLNEFKQLLTRIHSHGMKALIDFVPNHVARSYDSDVKPDQNFGTKGNGGAGDDRSAFFSPANNFFYLTPDGTGPPLKLPTCKNAKAVSPTCQTIAALSEGRGEAENGGHRPPLQQCDGLFDGEKDHGKVTGNNKPSWMPDIND